MDADCPICMESFNKKQRKKMVCGSCQLSACVACHERYNITLNTDDDPHCMKCKRLWDIDYIITNLSRSAMTRLKVYKETRLIQIERAKIPETQYYLQYDTHIRNVVKKKLSEVEEDVRVLASKMAMVEGTRVNPEYRSLDRAFNAAVNEATNLRSCVNAWVNGQQMLDRDHIPKPLLRSTLRLPHRRNTPRSPSAEHAGTHVCPCSSGSCNGFVMKSDWKCGVCATLSCKRCLATHNDDHVCTDTDIETATLILKTSRPCPSCATRIHKISGCDQMWCTRCNTAFSWESGTVTRGPVHNPHYFEWFLNRENLPDEPDRWCIRPAYHELVRHCLPKFGRESRTFNTIITIYRLSMHIEHAEIVRLNTPPSNNLDLRLKWLKNEITETHFGRVLFKRYKTDIVNQRKIQVYNMFVSLTNDLFRRVLQSHCDETIVTELLEIIQYTNDCFRNIWGVYKMKMPNIRLVHSAYMNMIDIFTTSNGLLQSIHYTD